MFAIFILAPKSSWANEDSVIYYSKYCTDCEIYLNSTLVPYLKNKGHSPQIKDYITQKEAKRELAEKTSELKIPKELIGHMMTFIDEKAILAGHVPQERIKEAFENQGNFKKILLYQDEMHGQPKTYKVWIGGKTYEFLIDESFTERINTDTENSDSKNNFLLPVVISGAFLDSLNPCAFAVLLSFIAFLLLLGRGKILVFRMGISYIFAIFIAYFLIGLGILGALSFFGQSHFMGKAGAIILIIIGLFGLLHFFNFKTPINLKFPEIPKETVKNLMVKATVPTSLAVGFLVGLCTFPCSGGPYVAILTVLSSQKWSFLGYLYLLLYNLIFIFPLLLILILASNRKTIEIIAKFQKKNARLTKLGVSAGSGILGILVWIFI